MKTTLFKRSFVLQVVFLAILTSNGFAATYTTIENGNYSDLNVWSTDGGLTNCFCTPGTTTNGDDIIVNHDITLTGHLIVNGGSEFTVNVSGTLYGPTFNLSTIGNSIVQINGSCVFNKLINGKSNGTFGSSITISNTITELNARIILYAGVTVLDGGYMYSTVGNFDVYENAEFYTLSGSKLELLNGNISISGLVDICADCCLTTKGNWTNEVTGTVQGSGSATTSVGNMTNLNDWSTDITWCSNGFDVGMPTPEDCNSSNSVCGVIVLPIELVSFEGRNRETYNELMWETASENNSDYFVLRSSYDGINWRLVGEVEAAGNSNFASYYSMIDDNLTDEGAIIYYRLEQVDQNGDRTFSNPISLSNYQASEELLVYPNPVGANTTLYIAGVQGEGQLRILSAKGEVLAHEAIQPINGMHQTTTANLIKGMYFVECSDLETGEIRRVRFVVE